MLHDQQYGVRGTRRGIWSWAALALLLAGCARPAPPPTPRFRDAGEPRSGASRVVGRPTPATDAAEGQGDREAARKAGEPRFGREAASGGGRAPGERQRRGPVPGGAAGLDFVHENGASGRKYFVETMGAGVALLDFDNDGWLDVLCVNGAPLPGSLPRRGSAAARSGPALFRSLGGRRFVNVTAAAGLEKSFYGMGCAVGDYDNDGWEDVYFSAVLGPGHLYHNRGGSGGGPIRFEDVTERAGVGNAGKWGTSCAWLDYDRDGRLDLFVANYVRYASLRDDIPCIVRPGRRSYCIPQGYEGSASVLYHNEGEGHFRDVTRRVGLEDPSMKALGVAVADVDQDGWPDLIVANDTVPNRLYLNRKGLFHEVAAEAGIAVSESGMPRAGMGVDTAAWREDGALGVAVTHFPRESMGLFTQELPGAPAPVGATHASARRPLAFRDAAEATGVAAPSRPWLGFGVLFLDFDNDGYADLAAVNGHVRDDVAELSPGETYAQPALLFRNEAGRRFRDVSAAAGPPITVPRVGRGLAAGDVDNDGRIDLLVSENHGPVRLWHNETPARGHWLLVRLEGTRSNRDGLGARISLLAGGRVQTSWARSGSSYLSASDRRVHFGLGAARTVDRLTVSWPSGRVTELSDLPVDRVLTVREVGGRAP